MPAPALYKPTLADLLTEEELTQVISYSTYGRLAWVSTRKVQPVRIRKAYHDILEKINDTYAGKPAWKFFKFAFEKYYLNAQGEKGSAHLSPLGLARFVKRIDGDPTPYLAYAAQRPHTSVYEEKDEREGSYLVFTFTLRSLIEDAPLIQARTGVNMYEEYADVPLKPLEILVEGELPPKAYYPADKSEKPLEYIVLKPIIPLSDGLANMDIVILTAGSRAFTHQLVRHQSFTFQQESQRYVVVLKGGFIIILGEEKESPFKEVYKRMLHIILRMYDRLLKREVDPEDARLVLPNATMSKIVMSGLLYAPRDTPSGMDGWMDFAAKRGLNKHAQWEIRKIAYGITESILQKAQERDEELRRMRLEDLLEAQAKSFFTTLSREEEDALAAQGFRIATPEDWAVRRRIVRALVGERAA